MSYISLISTQAAVSRMVFLYNSVKAYATMSKGSMGNGLELLDWNSKCYSVTEKTTQTDVLLLSPSWYTVNLHQGMLKCYYSWFQSVLSCIRFSGWQCGTTFIERVLWVSDLGVLYFCSVCSGLFGSKVRLKYKSKSKEKQEVKEVCSVYRLVSKIFILFVALLQDITWL